MPIVSVIVPCYNEQATIALLLDAIHKQTFPLEKIEVVIADGQSTDRTRAEIEIFASTHPELEVRVVDNPSRAIPAGLNRAIEASTGDYVVRLDAHSIPYPNYIERCVEALERKLGENVGGVWEIHPGGSHHKLPGPIARGIAAAAAHPLGVGDAFYRYTDKSRHVDTVPFGAFRKELFQQIGAFDESLLTNEDYEFNVRVQRAGGKVWLDPSIRSVYYARETLRELIRQYWRYGFWKARMLARYPETVRWRQAIPPLFVANLLVLSGLTPWCSLARSLLQVEFGLYFVILAFVSLHMAVRQKDIALMFWAPLAIAAMHVSWGAGFLWSLAGLTVSRKPE